MKVFQPQLGGTVTFTPTAFIGLDGNPKESDIAGRVSGRICYINHAHRFYMVRAEVNGQTIRECFKY